MFFVVHQMFLSIFNFHTVPIHSSLLLICRLSYSFNDVVLFIVLPVILFIYLFIMCMHIYLFVYYSIYYYYVYLLFVCWVTWYSLLLSLLLTQYSTEFTISVATLCLIAQNFLMNYLFIMSIIISFNDDIGFDWS